MPEAGEAHMREAAPRIVGLGVVTPYGLGVPVFWEALLAGRDAVAPLPWADAPDYLYRKAGYLDMAAEAPLTARWQGLHDRATRMAAEACREALEHAGVTAPKDRARTALLGATNFGGVGTGAALLAAAGDLTAARPEKCREDWPDAAPGHGLRKLREALGLGGPAGVLSLSCAAGTAALARAAEWLVTGRAERVLVVGYDALTRFAWSGLCALRTMTSDRVRPFDRRRAGTIFSEGAAALVLETAPSAARRGTAPLAVLRGWATGNNGTHMTAPAPLGAGSAEVMRRALARGGVAAGAIDHFDAHGTGTALNDPTEAAALHAVLGARAARVPTVSIKGAVGHLMGAAGSAAAIAAVLTLRTGWAPPTANHAELDPECVLDVVYGAPRAVAAANVLSNAAGIGGTNAAIVLGRADATPPAREW